jgi:hypothetical protein
MIQVDAEVLIIDEVLAVGDAAFQQKCFEEFERIRRSGTTVLLVTHDMGAVTRFCDRALLLEHGHRVEMGDPEQVGMRYLQLNFSREARDREAAGEASRANGGAADAPSAPIERLGDGQAHVVEAWVEDDAGERTDVLPGGRPACVVLRVRFAADVDDPVFGFTITNLEGRAILAANTTLDGRATGRFLAGDEVTVRCSFDNVLGPERYHVTPAVAHPGSGHAWMDWRKDLVTMTVSATRTAGGVLNVPVTIELDRRTASGVAR